MRTLYEQQTLIHVLFRRLKKSKWLIEFDSDEIGEIDSDLEQESMFDQLTCHTDYQARAEIYSFKFKKLKKFRKSEKKF